MSAIKIEKYRKGQETEISRLITKVYNEFVAPDYPDDGNSFFYDWIQPSRIAERQLEQINVWVAVRNSELIGMIEIRDNKFISLLFVEKAFQGRGIAKRLFKESLKEILVRDPDTEKFYVHSSPYSIMVYRKMGFTETGPMTEENGIKYLPMEMIIRTSIHSQPSGMTDVK